MKMDYKCDDVASESDVDDADMEAPQISEWQMDEAIEVLLDRRYRMVDQVPANTQSFWYRLFGGCLAEQVEEAELVGVAQRRPLNTCKTAHSLGVSLDRVSDVI